MIIKVNASLIWALRTTRYVYGAANQSNAIGASRRDLPFLEKADVR